MSRNRYLYAFLIAVTIVVGLTSRHFSKHIPLWIGDILWALMVFFMVGFVFFTKSTRWVGSVVLGFSYFIEISQLYHASWIDSIRATTLGGLVLGYHFLWSDILCYSIGIAIGLAIERLILSRFE